jgi:dienelactone hydrolase
MTRLSRFLVAILAAPVSAQDVSISARDGVTLQATYYSPGRPGPAAIIFRNCDQRRVAVDAFAAKFRDRGAHVVVYDYRPGLMAGKDWLETRAEDAAAVHAWLVRQAGVDSLRVATIGGSCGAQLALQSAMSNSPRVKAAVLLSGPSSDAAKAFVARSPHLAVLAVASAGENSEQYVKPVADSSRNPHSRLIVLPGRAHGTNMLIEPTGLDATALTWLAARLEHTTAAPRP